MRKSMKQIIHFVVLVGFMLGIKDGYIALWKDEDPEPYRVFPVPAASMPISDQLMLQQGIHIESTDQLLALIDDYL